MQTLTSVDYDAPTGIADILPLEIRQDSCLSWTQAPNQTVCCDESSGEWVLLSVQRDGTEAATMAVACQDQVGVVTDSGAAVASNVAPPPAAATTAASIIQQDYCSGEMQLPNATVCCDMSSGVWVPAPVQRDSMATNMVSAACPTTDDGTGESGVVEW